MASGSVNLSFQPPIEGRQSSVNFDGPWALMRLFDAGSLFYARGQYPPAIRAFEEAMRLVPLPAIGFSLAQAIRLQYFVDHDAAKLRRAIELYRSYVAATPAGGRRGDAVSMAYVMR